MRRILFFAAFVLLLANMWMALTVGRIAGPTGRIDTEIRAIDDYDWIVFTRADSVDLILSRLGVLELSPEHLAAVKIVAVEAEAVRILQEKGLAPDLEAEPATIAGALTTFEEADVADTKILVVGEIAGKNKLIEGLAAAGASVVRTLIDSPVRNILYAHVPSSICSLLAFTVLLVASVGYLVTRKPGWDLTAAASAEVALVLATILNATGMIFSRAEWNIWWSPSPRLVSSAILWFLAVVYIILRHSISGSHHHRARVCAVFGIIAFLDVPMVYISARFISDIHKPNFTLESPPQKIAFVLGIIGTIILSSALIWLKTDILKAKSRLEQLT